MGIPVELPALPPPDTNRRSRTVLGAIDLSQLIVTEYGAVKITGLKVDGWSGGTESTREVLQRAYRPGGRASKYPQPKSKVMTLSFTLNAESPAAMREAWDLLNVAASIDDTTLMRDQWGLTRTRTVFRQGDVAETLYRSALMKGWSCQLKAADPRMYGNRVTRTAGLPVVTGGVVAPLQAPVTNTAQTQTGIVAIRNDGTARSSVLVRVDGPCVAPVITHVGSGTSLVFGTSYTLPAGNWLDIDMDLRTVLENGVADRSQFVTSRGFFDADRGDNQYAFQADTYEAAALLTVTTASAWE